MSQVSLKSWPRRVTGGQGVRQRVLPQVLAIEGRAQVIKNAADRQVGVFLEKNQDKNDQRSELVMEILSMKLALTEYCVQQEYDRMAHDPFSRELGLG